MKLLVLFLFLTGAIAATLFFIQGVVHILRHGAEQYKKRYHNRTLVLGKPFRLTRADNNPILQPTGFPWEAIGVFNPAAVYIDGTVHLFYRAVGGDGVSRIGYAKSEDGFHFDYRLPYPIYGVRGGDDERAAAKRRRYNPDLYRELMASGGSWSGTEDPRAVVIDGRIYLSFSVFNNWDSLRIGISSLSVDDMLRERWNWARPTFLSAMHEVQKNWVVFPKKIRGKFAVFHGLRAGTRRRAVIEYLDSLDTEPEEYIKSDASFRNNPSQFDDNVWETRIRGAAAPPIETPEGWLLLYHANDAREPHKYKLGAMLLDKENPEKVIARAAYPLLEPDMPYENGAKPGIVYATGAIVKDEQLIVYYGGGDNVICAAAAPLTDILKSMRERTRPAFPIRVRNLIPSLS